MSNFNVGIYKQGDTIAHYSIDLTQAIHVAIGGASGSGKSVLMGNIIKSIDIPVILIDGKYGVEFSPYASYEKVINNRCYSTADDIHSILTKTVEVMEKRYKALIQSGAKNIDELGDNFSHIAIIIDEVQEVIINRKNKLLINQIAKQGRACGIHLILATQSPSKRVLGDTVAQCGAYICLKVNKPEESRLLLGIPDAINIPRLGGLYVKQGDIITAVQGYEP